MKNLTTKRGLRCAIYTRVSTDQGLEQDFNSLDAQREASEVIGKVNGRFGDAAWTPIRYVNRSYSRTVLAGMYRAADVAMMTPLRDGMNLVAKEYLAVQDPENPGVLMLSQFAGAAKELDRALIVNPHETDAVAAALKRALEMPLEERRGATPRCSPISCRTTSRNGRRPICRRWPAVCPSIVCWAASAHYSALGRTRLCSRFGEQQTPTEQTARMQKSV